MKHDELVRIAVENGAAKATVIPCDKIVTSEVFRDICASNSCGQYGRCWMCPPDNGDTEEVMAKVREYSHGLLYQTIAQLEDSYDIEGMAEGSNNHAKVSRKIGKILMPQLPENSLHLICGGCHYCERCAKIDNKPCYFPDEALSSMEGYCIDVYNTTKDTDLKYINGQNTSTFFSIILFSEE